MTRNKELNQAKYTIYEMKKTLDRSTHMQRDVRLDFEAHICELMEALKKYKDELSRESLQKEEVKRAFVHQKYQLDQANERFETLENQDQDATYPLMLNECGYYRNLYRGAETTMVEDQHITKYLQDLYLKWKGEFLNLARFANLTMQELLEKLQEVYWCMCPENTPYQVFNFVKFCKKMLKELTKDPATILKVEL